ncbi:hypothetical protein BS47DRAFT_1355150, partial [Hydnum rufescens UP504]
MGGYYDEIEIEDMTWDAEAGVYHYPCPCGDHFEVSCKQLAECEDIATCPSCSLVDFLTLLILDFEDDLDEDEEDESSSTGESEEPKEPAEDDAVAPSPRVLRIPSRASKSKAVETQTKKLPTGGMSSALLPVSESRVVAKNRERGVHWLWMGLHMGRVGSYQRVWILDGPF